MKTWTITLLAVAIPVATAFALPDRIGGLGNLFVDQTGQRLEDVALDKETWSADKIVGDWELNTREGRSEILQLKSAANVFGVRAETVKAEKSNGELKAFVILYRPMKDVAPSQEELLALLARNIGAYTGASAQSAETPAGNGPRRFDYEEFTIVLAPKPEHSVQVTIRRTSATPAVAGTR